MTRATIEKKVLQIFYDEFEIQNPGLEDDLREIHGFDSIDAIELLSGIEDMLGSELTQEEKKKAMDIRTINHIINYIENLFASRQYGRLSVNEGLPV